MTSSGQNESMEPFYEEDEYRDSLSTVDASGKRIWVFPKMPKGKFYDYRKYVSYVLLLFLFGMPFIQMNGRPFMLFNVLEAEFILFGIYFSPQDFHLFVIGMLIFVVFITLFTVVYGRLFCGWVCPQTIFMEMVFRRIEYWIEGDANAQRRLDKAGWTSAKIQKKTIKHVIFILISAVIAHTFLSYIIGAEEVWRIMTDPISEHWSGFIAMIIFTIVFYGVFSILREQVCTTICPYGRLQSVLVDESTLAVSYDFVRGEPRGKLSKARKDKKSNCNDGCSSCKDGGKTCPTDALAAQLSTIEPEPMGDCIDCKLCVQVCPTGIDIRNGIQLECVNCTACMDACDEVMVKIKKPEGLIRLDSYDAITTGEKQFFNKRVYAYSAVLLALLVLQSFLFINRSEVETLFLRTPGVMYQKSDDGYISNLYNYQLINKTDLEAVVTFEAEGMKGVIFDLVGAQPRTQKNKTSEGAVFIRIPEGMIKDRKTDLVIRVISDGRVIDEASTTFLGPVK